MGEYLPCAECGRDVSGEMRIALPDGGVRCLSMDCQRCFGCGDRLTGDEIEEAMSDGLHPMYCADCHDEHHRHQQADALIRSVGGTPPEEEEESDG